MYDTSQPEWKDYRTVRPAKEGWLKWRLQHRQLKDIKVIFLAKLRIRMVGSKNVLSPQFDRWDGYRVLLPSGSIEWSEYEGCLPGNSDVKLLDIIDVVNHPCPFCGQIPKWKYHGRFIGACPNDAEYFYLKCCSWFDGFKNRNSNPLTLALKRNEAIGKNLPHNPPQCCHVEN